MLREMSKEYSSSKQSGLTTQIRTFPRATQQGRFKCRCHVTVPAVPTQEAIPEEGGLKNKNEPSRKISGNLTKF